jgi:hypothetical protein
MSLQPHQQRVVIEFNDLQEKRRALAEFIVKNPVFRELDEAERERLKRQATAMTAYADVLEERMESWPQPFNPRVSATSTDDAAIEQQIQAKGLTAPRITPADIEANIASEHYFTAQHGVEGAMAALQLHQRHADTDTTVQQAPAPPFVSLTLLTFCVLVLRNGFTVTGESACASPENFDADIGRKVARQNAVQKIWPLMGYTLRQHLHDIKHALPPEA